MVVSDSLILQTHRVVTTTPIEKCICMISFIFYDLSEVLDRLLKLTNPLKTNTSIM